MDHFPALTDRLPSLLDCFPRPGINGPSPSTPEVTGHHFSIQDGKVRATLVYCVWVPGRGEELHKHFTFRNRVRWRVFMCYLDLVARSSNTVEKSVEPANRLLRPTKLPQSMPCERLTTFALFQPVGPTRRRGSVSRIDWEGGV